MCFNQYSFLDWTLPHAPVASGWRVREELPAWTPAGANLVFFKLTGMWDGCFSLWVTSKAKRGKHVNSLELIRFKSSLVRFLLEHLRVHLFCFSFHVGECIVGECVVGECVHLFLRWTRAQIKIYYFISTRLVSLIFGPSCCCKKKNIYIFKYKHK